MKHGIVAVMLTFSVTCGVMLRAAPVGIDRVAWMQGCWRLTAGSRTVEEQWTAPRGGTMLGTSRTVVDGQLTEYEFVVLRERGEALVYQAHPSGQLAGEFPLASVDGMSVLFENPQHDFPQRIGYRRDGARLTAWIEGTMGGRSRRVEFPYERVTCAAD